MKVRKSIAAAGIAVAALFVAAGCSSDTADKATDAASSVAGAASSAVTAATDAVTGLDNGKAQEILRKAVDPNTSAADLDGVVDTTNPATKAALQAYAKGSSQAGYTPDVYTVSAVKKDGDDKATATVAVKSPHAPAPVDITLAYVKADGDWKLSGDAVTQLVSMGGQH